VIIADNTLTGTGVVMAQRLEQLADPDGVVAQRSVSETIPDRMPFTFESLGENFLKGFDQPVMAFSVRLQEGEDLPEPEIFEPSHKAGHRNSGDSDKPSILVLPFSNISGDPDQEYLGDGITEDIIVNLSSFTGLNVKSRHASFAIKGDSQSIEEVVDKLQVQYIVEGSTRRLGDKVRISVQLDETGSGNQLWGKRFDFDVNDLFSVEEELVQTVVGTISGRIEKDLMSASLNKSSRDMQSYDFLMRGIYHFNKFNHEDNSLAIKYLMSCVELDPDNLEARVYLTIAHLGDIYDNWSDDWKHSQELARKHSKKALEIDPDDPYARLYMAEYLIFTKDFDRAASHIEKAIELNPNLPDGYILKGYLKAMTRQYEEALEYADLSIQIDPYNPHARWFAGQAYRSAGEYEQAVRIFRSSPYVSPSAHGEIAACLAGLGKIEEARSEMNIYLELAKDQMPNFPTSVQDWEMLWRNPLSYKYPEDADTFFDLLLKAGLCDKHM
jgi:adenylate cyclase